MNNSINESDNFLWLEDVTGEKSLNWVTEQNNITNEKLTKSDEFNTLQNNALEILEDKNKIPYIDIRNNYVYNFWQDTKHIKGLWRRTSLKNYREQNPNWEILLDIDKLSKQENENWVFKGSECLAPEYKQCLIYLSRGGKDASETREFDIDSKKFISDGFNLPEAKSWVGWKDQNSLYVGTDYGPGSLTDSGYPRILKLWKRGTAIDTAKTIYEATKTDMGVYGNSFHHGNETFDIIYRLSSFYESTKWARIGTQLMEIPLPKTAEIKSYFNKHLIIEIKTNLKFDDIEKTFLAGSILAFKTSAIEQHKVKSSDIVELFVPDKNSSIASVKKSKNYLLIGTMENVKGKIYSIKYENNKFEKAKLLDIKTDGDLRLSDTNEYGHDVTYYQEGFLTPRSLNHYDLQTNESSKLKSLSDKFNAKSMAVEQRWSTSKDGTKIPYFIVGKKDVLKAGNAPTELYGYGGFEVSNKPYYNDILGKLWLENGGVFVLANIRGGGEFGPHWHRSAILKNKHKSYDDFISVAEHLISTGVTSPKKLAISGGSNGGLLVGAVMTRRPDLFKSVICLVPLLDMLRYHKLLAGASWMAEYGNPDDPAMKEYILSYSPYQNLDKNKKYPEVLFMTSTKDDRVHPGHARKMAAKMMEQGHKNINYYENTEGGHAASSDLKQRAKMKALQYQFLMNTLNK